MKRERKKAELIASNLIAAGASIFWAKINYRPGLTPEPLENCVAEALKAWRATAEKLQNES